MSLPIIIIPSRFGSSRFPGKPLVDVAGMPLIERVWRNAQQVGLPTFVATDDERIANVVLAAGGRVVMTGNCRNGTERCAEAARNLGYAGPVVNWQGDSPLTDPNWIPLLLDTLDAGVEIATPVQIVESTAMDTLRMDFMSGTPGGTCAVVDSRYRALYFSKAPIPYRGPFWMHIGVYAYSGAALAAYGHAETVLERSEGLEQLRFLEHGWRVQCVPVGGPQIWEVNNPADVPIVERIIAGNHAAFGH